MKILTATALGLCSLVLLAAGTPRPDAGAWAQDAVDMEQSREIFEEYCAACHGYDGIKVIPEAPSFATGESLEKEDAELLGAIRDGKGEVMPPWADVLSDEEITAVLIFIRSFRDTR